MTGTDYSMRFSALTCGCSFIRLMATPAAPRHMIRDDPPADTNGIGTPMTGSRLTTTPMLTNAWPTIHTAMHTYAMVMYRSRTCTATISMHHVMTMNSRITMAAPTNPVSSPMMAKMKSLCASGR